jgi:Fibronectin type III domain
MKSNHRQVINIMLAFAMLSSAVAAQASPLKLQKPAPPTPPTTPGNFHATAVTTSSVTLAWNASTGGSGKIGYNIMNVTTGFSLNVGSLTSYDWDFGVEAGGTYTFYIQAYTTGSGTQESAPSPDITVTLAGTPLPVPVKPAPPVITSTSVTTNTISVSWTEANPASEIGSYFVTVNGMTNATTNATTTAATLTGLVPGYTYQVAVTAYSLNGQEGALSTTGAPVTVTTTAAVITPPANAPTAPTDLTGGGDGGGEAIISWNPSTSVNEPQADIQYNIYMDGVLDSFDGTVGQTSQVYIFPRGADLPAQVWVVAVDQFGNQSAPSNILSIPSF